jgi:hypothetical protein
MIIDDEKQRLLFGTAAGGLLGHLYGHYVAGEKTSLPYAGAGALLGSLALLLLSKAEEGPSQHVTSGGWNCARCTYDASAYANNKYNCFSCLESEPTRSDEVTSARLGCAPSP